MKKIFTLLTIVLATTTSWAQDAFQGDPELQKATSVVADGKTEYILAVQNTDGDLYYYGKGNDWGTRASAKAEVENALTVRFVPNTVTFEGNEVQCYKLNNYVSDKGGWSAMADCDGGLSSWVDGQGRAGDGMWKLKDLGNGQIELTNLQAGDGKFKFGVAFGLQVWDADSQDYVDATPGADALDFDNRCYFIGSNITNVYVTEESEEVDEEGNVKLDTIEVKDSRIYEGACTTWQLYDATTYNIRKALYEWYWNTTIDEEGNTGYYYDDADYPGVQKAIAAANTLYEKADATAEELQAAYDAIMAAVANIEVENNAALLEGADEENPMNLFEEGLLQNADFESGNIEGWNAKMTGNSNQYQSASYSNGSVTIKGFAESWTWNAQHSGDGEFTQQVALPAGMYMLEVDAIATRQQGKKADSKGVEIFAKSNFEEFATPVATENNAPEHFVLTFTVATPAKFTIGLREVSPTVNWIAVDNWKMTYYGQPTHTVAQLNMKSVIDDIDIQYAELEDIVAHKDATAEYDAAFEAANAAWENGGLEEDGYIELADSLKSKFSKLKASINDYKYFARCIETVRERIAEQTEKNNEDCASDLSEYVESLDEAYEAKEWLREQMNEILPKVSQILGQYAQIEKGDNVTYLLNNAAFEKDFFGWQTTGASPWWAANHGQGANNAELPEDQEIPAEDDGLAENYHNVFTMYQTLCNVPAGLYTLSVQGFNRHDDGNTESAQLFAEFGEGKVQAVDFAGIDDYATSFKLYDNGGWSSDATRTINGETYYAPNGMTGSAWHFMNKNNGVDYDYTNKFTILMRERGDMKVGVRCANTHQWVIFDNFQIVYQGNGPEVWEEPIREEMDKVQQKALESAVTAGCYNDIMDVNNYADEFCKDIANKTEQECLEVLDTVKAQYAVITENLSLVSTLSNLYESFTNLEEMAEEQSEALKARYDACADVFETIANNAEELTMNNAQLKAFIEEVNVVMGLVKIPAGWELASDENPVDFSTVIPNRFFNVDKSENPEEEPAAEKNYNFTEWSGKQPGTGGGEAANCAEIWNSAAFDSYMTFTNLPAGTYALSCQGFLRHGGGSADSYSIMIGEKTPEVRAYLYATTSVDSCAQVQLCNITESAVSTDIMAAIDADDENPYKITGTSLSTYNTNYRAPEQLASADMFFKNGYYKNRLFLKVGEEGSLRIGIRKDGAVSNDWVVFDNFGLTYYGKNSQIELIEHLDNMVTAIDSQKVFFAEKVLAVYKDTVKAQLAEKIEALATDIEAVKSTYEAAKAAGNLVASEKEIEDAIMAISYRILDMISEAKELDAATRTYTESVDLSAATGMEANSENVIEGTCIKVKVGDDAITVADGVMSIPTSAKITTNNGADITYIRIALNGNAAKRIKASREEAKKGWVITATEATWTGREKTVAMPQVDGAVLSATALEVTVQEASPVAPTDPSIFKATSIQEVVANAGNIANGKYIVKGKLVIVKNGKVFNAQGLQIK